MAIDVKGKTEEMGVDKADCIRIVIVDDQTLFREGMQTVLNLIEDIEVVGTADNGQEALFLVEQLHPDLVLMDVEMPVMNGVESTRRIKERYPNIPVLILSTFAQDDYIVEGLANGAGGYLLKDSRAEELASYIRQAVKGQIMLPAPIAAKLAVRLQQLSRQQPPRPMESKPAYGVLAPLTDRERDIAELMVQGYTNKEIAAKLYMSDGTIRNVISLIYSKLGTNDRVKAINVLRGQLSSDR
ncbi:response regulator [Marinicrinis lubricantis]|uniref:Response regulator n=1 Tax=Marinicrinis lubricantis TaxID=2086470 RepID=A0ABW1IUP2_9BACL